MLGTTPGTRKDQRGDEAHIPRETSLGAHGRLKEGAGPAGGVGGPVAGKGATSGPGVAGLAGPLGCFEPQCRFSGSVGHSCDDPRERDECAVFFFSHETVPEIWKI